MAPQRYILAVCGLLVVAGCLTGPVDRAGPPAGTSTLSADIVGQRAISAEQSRVERRVDASENLTGLLFGNLEPAEYEVVRRNGSGVVVRVSVGYSVSVDCDGDGTPESAVDGANTEATYFLTDADSRLLEVTQDVVDPEEYC